MILPLNRRIDQKEIILLLLVLLLLLIKIISYFEIFYKDHLRLKDNLLREINFIFIMKF